ncbi:MAG: hypothetical protein AB1671_01075 [Thermodesulfobacteriota bacterium]|jgi:hypothetical protein
MKRHNRQRLWTAGGVALTLLMFVAGTSFACVQQFRTAAAEACCHRHCQHAMTGAAAAACCQQFYAAISPALPASPAAKPASLVAAPLPVSLILAGALRGAGPLLVHVPTGEQPLRSPPLYALHCTFLR